MLNIKTRQKYLKELGFYDGPVSGIENIKTKKAYKSLQQRYFQRKKDLTGIYDNNTNNLLISAMRVHTYTKDFTLEEFACPCSKCCGYPATLKSDLLKDLQMLRDDYKLPITITSGLRCKFENSTSTGSISKSRHMTGKAVDLYIPKKSNNSIGRKKIIKVWMTYPKANYAYQGTPNMGNATHVDTK